MGKRFFLELGYVSVVLAMACEGSVADVDGPEDSGTSVQSARTTLSAPTNLTATSASPTSIQVRFTDANTNEDGFQVERALGATTVFTLRATLAKDATSFLDAGLPTGATFRYRVRAFGHQGSRTLVSAYSNIASATTTGACVPAPESCNGVDDDCDGLIDDGIPTGATCDGGDGDACKEGLLTCTGGTFVCSDSTATNSESCNGIDDDCDGAVDDGVPGGATCDGADGDACREGVLSCSGGTYLCSDNTGTTPELCNAIDDDCDGLINEGFALGVACDGADGDLCAEGITVCNPGGTGTLCSDASGTNSESCNGIDDDCDGVIDDGVNCCFPEICNGEDDDCDGVVDNGVCASETLLLASDAAPRDELGQAVAISGNYAVLGAPGSGTDGTRPGSAYVFRWNGSAWIQQQELVASDSEAYQSFGISVAIEGDVAVIGKRDNDAGVNSGSVYVFRRNDNGTPTNFSDDVWQQRQKIVPTGGAAYDYFGISVGISGSTIIVGASQGNPLSAYGNGAAFIYRYNGATYIEEAKLLASDGAFGDRFGWSVAVSGEAVLVGAYLDQDAVSGTGSAYVYGRSGTIWTQRQKLLPSGGPLLTQFGTSVALDGSLAVVGDPFDDDRGTNFGSVSVFRFNGSTWVKQTELYGSDSATNERFGASVAADGDVVVIGAWNEGSSGAPNMDGYGAVYEFRTSGGIWTEERKLVAFDGARTDLLGQSVGVSGSVVLTGAPGYGRTVYRTGAAYIF